VCRFPLRTTQPPQKSLPARAAGGHLLAMSVSFSELIVPFTGAIQSAISVLLTIGFGVVAAQCNLLSPNAAKEVSKLCVRMFLPALLIYKIGSNLHQDTGVRYVPVLSKFIVLIKIEQARCLHGLHSMVYIIYTFLYPHRSSPHALLQTAQLRHNCYCIQQHNLTTASSHAIAQANTHSRFNTHPWRVGKRGNGSCRVILFGERHD